MHHPKDNNFNLDGYLESIRNHGRTMLLPALIQTQKSNGFISQKSAKKISEALRIPLADISGVIGFYSMLSDRPLGNVKIGVCTSPVCISHGANEILDAFQNNTASDHEDIFVEPVACLGLCDHAPAGLIGDTQIGNINTHSLDELEAYPPPTSQVYGSKRVITKNFTYQIKPSLTAFLEKGGFEGLEKAFSYPPTQVIEIIKSSGLRGRGGAGFPTGIKWEGAAQAPGNEKYLVCNLDESEPGTFKDRSLILGDPFKILEGIIITAYSIGATKGYCYIRGEYPEATRVMKDVIIQARDTGYLGENIKGTGLNFELEIRSGAGAYICGEETALFESIEGKRGFPRIKPPFPTTHGLFGKPTVINNVETFANIPTILSVGVDKYRLMGSENDPGPRLFSVSGDIALPGIYEITEPITLRDLIFTQAGGIPDNQELQGVLLGGAAGKFISHDLLDMLLSDEAARENNLSLGSGAVMVFDTSRDMRKIITSLGHFFAHESCGKCYPCQLGTQRQAEILERNERGKLMLGDVQRLKDVGWTMTDASLCGLGQTAALGVLSAIELWPDLFVEKEISTNG